MAIGMPELHSLTPLLGNLQDQGHKVAPGSLTGACRVHRARYPPPFICPEAVDGGAIGKIIDGDMITLDAVKGVLMVDADLGSRTPLDLCEHATTTRLCPPAFCRIAPVCRWRRSRCGDVPGVSINERGNANQMIQAFLIWVP